VTDANLAVSGTLETLPCHICKTVCQSTAGDPGQWPLFLPFPDGNGQTRPYHMKCVVLAVEQYESFGSKPGIVFFPEGIRICKEIVRRELERNPENFKEALRLLGMTDVLKMVDCGNGCSADGFYYDEHCPVHEPDPWFGTHLHEALAVLKYWWNSSSLNCWLNGHDDVPHLFACVKCKRCGKVRSVDAGRCP
jgi:hypothetical protein